jgi:putative transposase
MGGHKPKVLRGDHRLWLIERCKAREFTLRGLVGELAAERDVKVDYRSVWEFVHAEGLSFKKNSSARRTESSRRSKKARAVGKPSEAH